VTVRNCSASAPGETAPHEPRATLDSPERPEPTQAAPPGPRCRRPGPAASPRCRALPPSGS